MDKMVRWINDGFDEGGRMRPLEGGGTPCPGMSVTRSPNVRISIPSPWGGPAGHGPTQPAPAGSAVEMWLAGRRPGLRAKLNQALLSLPKPTMATGWGIASARAWLRATCLAIKNDAADELWDLVRAHGEHLEGTDWVTMPTEVVCEACRAELADLLERAGAWQAELEIRKALAAFLHDRVQARGERFFTDELIVARIALGDVHQRMGQFDPARQAYTSALEMAHELHDALEEEPDSMRWVSVSLGCLARLAAAEGNLDEAMRLALDALDIDLDCLADLNDGEDLGTTLGMLARFAGSPGPEGQGPSNWGAALARCRQTWQSDRCKETTFLLCQALCMASDKASASGMLECASDLLGLAREIIRNRNGASTEDEPARLERLRWHLEARRRMASVAEARDEHERSRRLLAQVGRGCKAVVRHLEQLAGTARANGNAHEERRLREHALDVRKIALEVGRLRHATENSLGSAYWLSYCLMEAAQDAKATKKPAYAENLAVEAYSLAYAVHEQLRKPSSRAHLSQSAGFLAGLGETPDHLSRALALARQAEALSHEVAGAAVTDARADACVRNNCTWIGVSTARLLAQLGRHEEAYDTLERTKSDIEWLEACGAALELETAAEHHECTADALEALGRGEEAAPHRLRARALRERIAGLEE